MITRSSWKGPFVEKSLLQSIRYSKNSVIKTMSRSSTILPSFLGKIFQIHNGRFFLPVTITNAMLNKKLGEFCFTRAKYFYKKKKKKNNGSKSKSK